jgi:hypothetical protein
VPLCVGIGTTLLIIFRHWLPCLSDSDAPAMDGS